MAPLVTTDLAVDNSGNVYVGGGFEGIASFDLTGSGFVLTSAGGEDGFITRFDADGTLGWAVRYGGTGLDEVSALTVDLSGNLYAGGAFNGVATTLPVPGVSIQSAGGRDGFILSMTTAGAAGPSAAHARLPSKRHLLREHHEGRPARGLERLADLRRAAPGALGQERLEEARVECVGLDDDAEPQAPAGRVEAPPVAQRRPLARGQTRVEQLALEVQADLARDDELLAAARLQAERLHARGVQVLRFAAEIHF